ncbi:transcriptional repressor [Candidatus Parcubacteria bacterium]|nr:MAG: transcriptional repressor [Candidatus Parcubacteria bacterium]
MKKTGKSPLNEILREAGFRATPGKIAILEALFKADQPLTIAEISKKLKNNLDQTTLYRTIQSFVEEKIARALNFNDRSIRYESLIDAPHHHHVICKKCNYVEDVDICGANLEKLALVKSKSFKAIESHAVELFGTCNNCLKKN